MRKTLEYILKILAKMTLFRYRPFVIGVTGSVGKTSAKEAIYSVLKNKMRTRRNIKNYNNEIGVPLTILGSYLSPPTNIKGLFGWVKIISLSLLKLVYQKYPKALILELGISKPGDMKYLMSFVHPKIGVFTAIGEFPSHIEFFPEREKLVGEKSILIKSLPKDGLAVLNYDDLSVRQAGKDLFKKIPIIQYGFGQGADLKIEGYETRIENLKKQDFGINFKLDYQGSFVPIRLTKVLGKHHVFAAAAGAAVGLKLGLNLIEVAQELKDYYSLPGRSNLIEGIKKTLIIDDTYNASPLSVESALDLLNEVAKANEGSRKIAVLGDMMELGAETEPGHRLIGRKIIKKADFLFAVGERARFISDEAKLKGFKKENIFEFSDVEKTGLKLQETMEQNDVILIKGSRFMRMEKIVKEVMACPEKAEELLI